jgi:V/A-type H+/Na+-transporting ATPase subunit D
MAKLALNKSSLFRLRRELQLFERFLPTLDLKRKQLIAELGKARDALRLDEEAMAALAEETAQRLPMLANGQIDLSRLVVLDRVQLGEVNLLGVLLPVLEDVSYRIRPYSMLAKPHWVDHLVEQLKAMLALRVRHQVNEERMKRLRQAVRRITQRVNLFDKVLIPGAKRDIKQIEVFIADNERAGVVRSKIAKAKNLARSKENAA